MPEENTGNRSQSAFQPPLPAMPGPSWFARNQKQLARLAIVAVVLAGAYIYSRYQNPQNPPIDEKKISAALELKTEDQKGPRIKVVDSKISAPAENNSQQIRTEGDSVVVTAASGQGYTHLARMALAEYLKAHPNPGLTPEHKIYIEDYLQKHLPGSSGVKTGDRVSFSESQLNDAVSSAQGLTSGQLSNLHQYAVRVPSLN